MIGSEGRLEDLVRTISKASGGGATRPSVKGRSPSLGDVTSNFGERDGLYTGLGLGGLSGVSSSPRVTSMTTRTPRRPRMDGMGDAPPSAFRPTRSVSSTVLSSPITPLTSTLSTSGSVTPKEPPANPGWSVTSSFANSFTQLVKLGSDVGDSLTSTLKLRGPDRSLVSLIGPLGIMGSLAPDPLSQAAADEKPHLQFTFTLEGKVRIGCTVYFASAFDGLRRRCAVGASLVSSLERCEGWEARGGKSKAAFFKTRDGRYVVKELVSKWNVSDT
jgi:1-phosphatidylinositol-3-phosphate 5-kinase